MDLPPAYDAALRYPIASMASNYTYPAIPTNNTNLQPNKGYNPNTQRRQPIGEIKLYDDSAERRKQEELADLYSIIKVTELLEAAYGRDAITSAQYSEACTKLITQYKSTESALIKAGYIINSEQFMQDYGILASCPRAYTRLIKEGVPATIMHVTHDERADSVIVAETVQAFITTMDALKLNMHAVDEIHPLISDLVNALARVKGLTSDYEGLIKLRLWLQTLHQMRAADELSDESCRQLIFDLDSSYTAFHRFLTMK